MSWKTFAPKDLAKRGISVGGAMRCTLAPMVLSSEMLERATRLWRISPQMAMVRSLMRPSLLRMVRASSRACVG